MADERTAALIARLGELEVAAVWISSRADVRYLSGFSGSNGHLIISAEERLLVTDFRYRTQASEQAPDYTLVEMKPGQYLHEALAEALTARDLSAVGFQSDQVTHATWTKLAEKLAWSPERLKPLSGAVSPLREVKDAGEVAALRRSAALTDQVIERAFERARPGLTERKLKAMIEYDMLDLGADGAAFDTIVAGGPNTALPHAPITSRPLAEGDLLTIDLGVLVDGYCSDLTRTVALGACSPEQQAIYELVYEAHMAALAATRPGVLGKDVDEVARSIIRGAGHDDHFGHGLGHGVGVEIHEGPRLSKLGDKELVPGNVVTIEPGVYVPGLGGVRIEDLVVVTETGCERLSLADKPPRLRILS